MTRRSWKHSWSTLDIEMKSVLIILNIVAAAGIFLFSFAWDYANSLWLHDKIGIMAAEGVVNYDLSRGFLDQHEVKQAEDDSVRLMWYLRPSEGYSGLVIPIIFILNAALIGIFWRRSPQKPDPHIHLTDVVHGTKDVQQD